jgi:hypothetical protein
MTKTSYKTKAEPPSRPTNAARYDLWLDGKPAATDLLAATVEDLLKLDASEITWALAEHGAVTVLAADGERELVLVEHGDRPPTEDK